MSNPIADLVREVEELRRRMENIMRPAKVAEVRHSDGRVKIRAGDWTSDWLPWTELSGGIKTRNMPTAGQEVVGFFPSGELAAGFVMPGHFTSQNQPPVAAGGESVFTRGSVTQTITDSRMTIEAPEIVLKAGGTTITISGDGYTQTGGHKKHDGKNVGKDHVHGGIVPGGADTDVPSN